MGVKLEIAYHLQHYVENKEYLDIDAATIADTLEKMIQQYPAIRPEIWDINGDLSVILLHNGEPVMDGALRNPVKDGDVVGIYPIIEGG